MARSYPPARARGDFFLLNGCERLKGWQCSNHFEDEFFGLVGFDVDCDFSVLEVYVGDVSGEAYF